MFRVNTNVSAINTRRHLGTASSDLQTRLERLSSGLRINKSGDDAAGLTASEGMRSQITGMKQSNQNISQALAMMQTADSGLDQIGKMLNRLKQLAEQSADASYNPNNKSAISLEAQALVNEIERISQTTVYNGMTIINSAGIGTGVVFTFFIGDGTATVSSSNQTATLTLSGVTFGTAGLGSIDGNVVNITVADFLTGGTTAAALVSAADTAINKLSALRTKIGSFMNRLERTQSNLTLSLENTENAESLVRNADFAEESAALTRASILVQAGTSLLNQANLLPQNALTLIGG